MMMDNWSQSTIDYIDRKEKEIQRLRAIIKSAVDNADRLPFVVGIQFEDFNAMRKEALDD
jgi:hypothetical protein